MIKLLSLFSGIGAFEKALSRQNMEYDLVNYCEIDKYATKSYSKIHGVSEDKNLGDITKIDVNSLPSIDLITYGFPCQDISLSGKQKGLFNEDGTHTRSGLFFEALKIIEHSKPKIAIAENVKNLTSKKFAEQFKIVLESLEEAGYNNYWKVLNAKDYGIPQNRERVFIISIRKDVDNGTFVFPESFKLTKKLKDILEKDVDKSFYVSTKGVKYITSPKRGMATDINANVSQPLLAMGNANWTGSFVSSDIDHLEKTSELGGKTPTKIFLKNGDILLNDGENITTNFNKTSSSNEPVNTNEATAVAMRGRIFSKGVYEQQLELSDRNYANAITTVQKDSLIAEPSEDIHCMQVAQIYGTEKEPNPQAGRVYDANGLSPTMDTCSGGNRMPKILEDFYSNRDVREYEEYSPALRSERNGLKVVEPEIEPEFFTKDKRVLETIGKANFSDNALYLDVFNRNVIEEHTQALTEGMAHQQRNIIYDTLRIRKLTPKECFRLMGFDDKDYEEASKVVSNSQLYKQAGNSIVVNVLEEIFKKIQETNIL